MESLVGFTQKNKTSSGFEVELDGFYTVSEFQEDMESDEYKKKEKWSGMESKCNKIYW